MGKKIDLDDRIYNFALSIVKFVRSLPRGMVAQEIGKQLLRCGTSVAANYEEAKGAFSKEDFSYKMSLSFKEGRESNLWLRLLRDAGIVRPENIAVLLAEFVEVRNILGSSVKTSRKRKKL